jgi:cytochrome c oxidase cbb3-type subunit 3
VAWTAVAAVALSAAGCDKGGGPEAGPPAKGRLPGDGVLASVPLGDLSGARNDALKWSIRNPYANDPAAIREGERLFGQMNCAGCHGYDLTGGMGPDLTDGFWRYGGTPSEIFKSIHDGRPKGMPAWGGMLADEDIWRITAYIQSMGGAVPPGRGIQPVGSTEDDGPASRTMKGRSGTSED